jgi:hypothetical protein
VINTQIIAPVYFDWTWSLYVWNFERRTIIVIDPVAMVGGCHMVMQKHAQIVDKLHQAMTTLKEKLFKFPVILMNDWHREFLTVEGAHGNR